MEYFFLCYLASEKLRYHSEKREIFLVAINVLFSTFWFSILSYADLADYLNEEI